MAHGCRDQLKRAKQNYEQESRNGLDTGSNLQKQKVPEISSGPRQEKRDKPDPRLTGLVPLVPGTNKRIPYQSTKTEGTGEFSSDPVSKPNFATKCLLVSS